MSMPLRVALVLGMALVGCSPSTATNDAGGTGVDTGVDTGATPSDTGATPSDTGATPSDAGAIAADCVIYCQGFYTCGNLASSCPFSMTEAAFRADCEPACVSAAMAMTATQVDEATTCLHCLDGLVDASTCTGTGLGDAGHGNAFFDAIATCGATCMTGGVMTINDAMSHALLVPDAGRIICDGGP
jgi:hypothetical protein